MPVRGLVVDERPRVSRALIDSRALAAKGLIAPAVAPAAAGITPATGVVSPVAAVAVMPVSAGAVSASDLNRDPVIPGPLGMHRERVTSPRNRTCCPSEFSPTTRSA